jgi:outer membrane protein assembly factor BamE
MRKLFGALSFSLLLGACSSISSPIPYLSIYRLDVNQGNYVTQDQVEKLKVGQTRQTVKAILGTPLVADPFHAARWDYVYDFARRGRVLEHRQFTVYFVDDKLARWEGDEMPPPPADVARSGGGDAALDKSLSTAPKTGETNWLEDLLRKLGWWQ